MGPGPARRTFSSPAWAELCISEFCTNFANLCNKQRHLTRPGVMTSAFIKYNWGLVAENKWFFSSLKIGNMWKRSILEFHVVSHVVFPGNAANFQNKISQELLALTTRIFIFLKEEIWEYYMVLRDLKYLRYLLRYWASNFRGSNLKSTFLMIDSAVWSRRKYCWLPSMSSIIQ